MPDVYNGPYGTYTTLGGTVTAAQKVSAATNFANLAALFGTQGYLAGSGQSNPTAHPDFDRIHPLTAKLIQAELTALAVTLSAAATT